MKDLEPELRRGRGRRLCACGLYLVPLCTLVLYVYNVGGVWCMNGDGCGNGSVCELVTCVRLEKEREGEERERERETRELGEEGERSACACALRGLV